MQSWRVSFLIVAAIFIVVGTGEEPTGVPALKMNESHDVGP